MKKFTWMTFCLLFSACSILSTPTPRATTPGDLSVSMQRGPCFGACPVYELKLNAAGKVMYNGQNFVRVLGGQEYTLSAEHVQDLVEAIQTAHFFELNDQYTASVTDMPSVTLSITLDGQTKTIYHYGSLSCEGELDSAPKTLCDLENKIDALAQVERWVK